MKDDGGAMYMENLGINTNGTPISLKYIYDFANWGATNQFNMIPNAYGTEQHNVVKIKNDARNKY